MCPTRSLIGLSGFTHRFSAPSRRSSVELLATPEVTICDSPSPNASMEVETLRACCMVKNSAWICASAAHGCRKASKHSSCRRWSVVKRVSSSSCPKCKQQTCARADRATEARPTTRGRLTLGQAHHDQDRPGASAADNVQSPRSATLWLKLLPGPHLAGLIKERMLPRQGMHVTSARQCLAEGIRWQGKSCQVHTVNSLSAEKYI